MNPAYGIQYFSSNLYPQQNNGIDNKRNRLGTGYTITSYEQQEFRENTAVLTKSNPLFYFTESQLSRGRKWGRRNAFECRKEKHMILQNIVNANKKLYSLQYRK